MKQDNIRLSGEVMQALGNANFKVTTDNGLEIICTISGKIRKNYIRITPGDKVDIEISPYDLTKGRIVQRKKIQVNPENN